MAGSSEIPCLDLHGETLRLLAYVTSAMSRREICEQSGINPHWLEKLAQGRIPNPGVQNIQQLHNWLVAHGVRLAKARSATWILELAVQVIPGDEIAAMAGVPVSMVRSALLHGKVPEGSPHLDQLLIWLESWRDAHEAAQPKRVGER